MPFVLPTGETLIPCTGERFKRGELGSLVVVLASGEKLGPIGPSDMVRLASGPVLGVALWRMMQ